jgi:hypothetical protein
MFALFLGYECLYGLKHLKEGTRLGDISRGSKIILNWIKIHSRGGFGLEKLWPVLNKVINLLVLVMREIVD